MVEKYSFDNGSIGGFDARNRLKDIENLENGKFDILVIGGGITGAGILRDASLRGMKAALVEKSDFAAGTSSRSSKLIHGGLRYLENLDFKLVFEAQAERRILRNIAPNLVEPIPFIFPVYKSFFEVLKVRAGLILYDVLALFRNYKVHTPLSAHDIERLEPALDKHNVKGGVFYYDSFTDDIRLTIESIKSGVRAGGTAVNRVEAVGFRRKGDVVESVTVRDHETGRKFDVRAKVTLVAGGPWTDQLLEKSGISSNHLLRPTKGAHLILERKRVRNVNTVVMPSLDDEGRILFCIPWGDKIIAGTTDTDFDGSGDDVRVERVDAEYILEHVNHYFPRAGLGLDDVISGYAGLRPLLSQEGVSESKVSREHKIIKVADNMLVIAGGKLTTYRKMAGEMLDKAVLLMEDGNDFRRCATANFPLIESKTINNSQEWSGPPEDENEWKGDRETEVYLRKTYGPEISTIALESNKTPSLGERLLPGLPAVKAQIVYSVKEEYCSHLDDFFMRRTSIFLKDRQLGSGAAESAAEIMGDLLGWDTEQRKLEIERLLEQNRFNLAFRDE